MLAKLPLKFVFILFGVLGATFLAHYFTLSNLGLPPLADLLVASYVVNYLLAAAIFIGLYAGRHKFKNALGFLFMGGSLIKFLVFFLVFYPVYRENGVMERTEFAAFFIPYITALILETFFASKMLNAVSDS